MHSEFSWHQQANCVFFQGSWTHDAVSSAWQQLVKTGVDLVNVSEVEAFDSAFLTLLLQLIPSAQGTLVIQGANNAMHSLLGLYNLGAVFMTEVSVS